MHWRRGGRGGAGPRTKNCGTIRLRRIVEGKWIPDKFGRDKSSRAIGARRFRREGCTPLCHGEHREGTPLCRGERREGTPLCRRERRGCTPLCHGERHEGTPLCREERRAGTPLCHGGRREGTPLCRGEDREGTPFCRGEHRAGTPFCHGEGREGTSRSGLSKKAARERRFAIGNGKAQFDQMCQRLARDGLKA